MKVRLKWELTHFAGTVFSLHDVITSFSIMAYCNGLLKIAYKSQSISNHNTPSPFKTAFHCVRKKWKGDRETGGWLS